MAVYFFYGDEDFLIEQELNKMSSKLNRDFISMSLKTLENPDYQTLINVLRATPMMFGDMLAVINMEEYLYSKKKSFEDKELEDIEDALKNNPNGLDVAFVVKIPREDNKKLDARRKLYKILSKYNAKEFAVLKSYSKELPIWIKKCAKDNGITIDEDAIEVLINQIGSNLRDLNSEIEKLVLVSYPQKNVTKKMVEDNCISNEGLFNFTDFIMDGRKDKALSELKRLLDKKHPLEILSATQTVLRKWIIIKTKSSLPVFELMKLTGMTEGMVKRTSMLLKNKNIGDLVKLKQNLYKAEVRIKSAESVDLISEVECAVIR